MAGAMANNFCIVCLALLLGGCLEDEFSREDALAKRAAEAFGLTDVRTEGGFQLGSWANGCDRHDAYARRFTAKNAQGLAVHGVACAGFFFKDWTVRISL